MAEVCPPVEVPPTPVGRLSGVSDAFCHHFAPGATRRSAESDLTQPPWKWIVKRMLNQMTSSQLDAVAHALADPTRRAIVDQLGGGPSSVTTLAAPLAMSLPAVVHHLRVLEQSGLVATEKVGRVRMCRLEREPLDQLQDWIAVRKQMWERRLDRLETALSVEAATSPIDASRHKEERR